jgi:hypothetical protein
MLEKSARMNPSGKQIIEHLAVAQERPQADGLPVFPATRDDRHV